VLQVTYTNGVTKPHYIWDLAEKHRIYWNSNPREGMADHWTDDGYYQGPYDFDIMSIQYPITKKSADLGVILYYRGAQAYVKVNVYATLLKLEATPAITFWPNPAWDNDVDNGVGGPLELSKQIEVKAWYAAINDANQQKDIILTYFFANPYRPYKTGPFYLFGTSEDKDDEDEIEPIEPSYGYADDSTYAKGFQKYLDNQIKGKETKTNVTVRHAVSVWVDHNDPLQVTSNGDGITNYFESVFKARYNLTGTYYYGMLPNGWSPYNPNNTKRPFAKIPNPDYDSSEPNTPYNRPTMSDPSSNFGPKVNQNKKAKIAVTWVNHKV